MTRSVLGAALVLCVACDDAVPHLDTAPPGVVFTYPIDGQLDVPIGARVVVTFSDPVTESALGACTTTSGAFCLVGPSGVVDATPEVTNEGRSVSFSGAALEPGTEYQLFVRGELAPTAENLRGSEPLLSFTTRSSRPRAAAPGLVAINGGDPTQVGASFRPMYETTTLRLLFSEPLDPRSVRLDAGSIELLDAGGSAVPATLISDGIHVSIDPHDDLTAGSMYLLRLGTQLVDLGGQPLAATTVMFVPTGSRGAAPIAQVLRTRVEGDVGPESSRSGATPNEIVIDKPLIGRQTSTMLPSTLQTEMGDPKALGGPIAFKLRRGQRLASTGMSIALGGEIPVGLETGDVLIELLTDATGRLYRNPYQDPEQRPENNRSPVYVDLSMDVAVYARDPQGNAVLTQTVLGVQATGTAVSTDGVLSIETVAAMELGLLGVTEAPTNLVLELITDPAATVTNDTLAPKLLATSPSASAEHPVDAGIELTFDEPIDLDRARAGGIVLEDASNGPVPSVIESHGAGVVIRPLAPLPYSRVYRVVFTDVADLAGNKLVQPNLSFTSPTLLNSDVPPTVVAIHPGAPCSLTDGNASSPGRCSGGDDNDDMYQPFTMAPHDPIDVTFSGPLRRSSVTRGQICGQGSVRVEELDASNTCTGAVAGTLIARDRSLTFVPDQPWVTGKRYRLTLVSGGDDGCSSGELCGPNSAVSFDPLSGSSDGDGGGPSLVVVFTATEPTRGTYMLSAVSPFSDINGSGHQEDGEHARDDNRTVLRLVGTTGAISAAEFTSTDCLPSTPERESCMYMHGSIPVEMGELTTTCPLPGGGSAAKCVPVTMGAQQMFGTSVQMRATAAGIDINTETGVSVMRVREPNGAPLRGYIVDRGGTPTMIASLDLYMDAPDMSVALSSHDLHSKPLSVLLEGPLNFLPDGRIAIGLTNTADMPVDVNITAPFGIQGSTKMLVPKGEMKLQLLSPAPRGASL